VDPDTYQLEVTGLGVEKVLYDSSADMVKAVRV
jgi:hypothetical protein